MRTLYDGVSFDIIREAPTFAGGDFTSNYQQNGGYTSSGDNTGQRYRYIEETYTDERYKYIDDGCRTLSLFCTWRSSDVRLHI